MDKYQKKRKYVESYFFSIIKQYDISSNLRGSWCNSEFHLSKTNLVSYSDVDLFIQDISTENKEKLIKSLNGEFNQFFENEIKISIHSSNSLSNMTIQDANILAMGEYIALYKKHIQFGLIPQDYFIAKFILIMLRKNLNYTYFQAATNTNISKSLKVMLRYQTWIYRSIR
jgi:hypothetical protein